ncbi:hypothetical protein POSPLADRAFT_1075940 [Postia placenta MAD-698-R-SB12]|uniref:Uncharacterized protein n=2 Tax=Postia placenta MAD-698-R-SB12 TaxID=670580 RepID=A0A1X6MNY4_9APHY|nr:hypothetical protein POSPLADRAFT_1075940 [Postia placenta MAD-698-R-SB12]OSX58131.1 hypothetical protein POSPLADRAFT_1075940 [Postia placenta MAD-698-R-SB12]
MLWLQIASQMGITLLAFVAQMQGYNTLYPTHTIGLLLNAVVPHILTIAGIAHSFVATASHRSAYPAQYSSPDQTATISSKDLILWTPTVIPMSERWHLPSAATPPVPQASIVTATHNCTSASQLEYPTLDFIVGEWRTALEEPVDMSQSINCLARGILAIAIAGSAYFVIKACIHWITRRSLYASQWRSMSVVSSTFASDTDAGASSLFNVELALDYEDASADFLSAMFDIISGSGVATDPDWKIYNDVYPTETAQTASESGAPNNVDITNELKTSPVPTEEHSTSYTALYPDAAPAHFHSDDVVYNPDTLAANDTKNAQEAADLTQEGPSIEAEETFPEVNHSAEPANEDAPGCADISTPAATDETEKKEACSHPAAEDSTSRTALHLDAAPAQFYGDDAAYNPDTLAEHDAQNAQETAELTLEGPCIEAGKTVKDFQESANDDVHGRAYISTFIASDETDSQQKDVCSRPCVELLPHGCGIPMDQIEQAQAKKPACDDSRLVEESAWPDKAHTQVEARPTLLEEKQVNQKKDLCDEDAHQSLKERKPQEDGGKEEQLTDGAREEQEEHEKEATEAVQEHEVKVVQEETDRDVRVERERTVPDDQIAKDARGKKSEADDDIECLDQKEHGTLPHRISEDVGSRSRRKPHLLSSTKNNSSFLPERSSSDDHAQSSTFPSAHEHTSTATSGLTCVSMSHEKPQIIYQTDPKASSINYTRAPSSFEHFVFSDLPEGPLGYQTPVLPEVSCDYERVYIPTPNPPRSLRATPSSAPSRVAPSVNVPSPSPTSPPSGEASGSAQGESTERRRPRNYGERAFQSAFAAALRPRRER